MLGSMKKSSLHTKQMDYVLDHVNGFDPQTDFYQFLEEAKHYAIEADFKPSSDYPKEREHEIKIKDKKKKSWKKFLFPWLKGEKMNKSSTKPAAVSPACDTRRRNVSGPVYGTGMATDGRHRRPMSGPIASLFAPTKRSENAVAYVCLEKKESPVQAYGPVYLVT